HVIENMYDGQRAEHSVRFSFGFKNTEEEILKAVNVLNDLYEKGKYNG
ncbi:MAG: cysteine desulfurase, partial [Finegoldia magna]|nr:cysteine desulfurase [Finegoldia magna]